MDRLKVATAWLGGCSGCHMSLLDLDEWLIELSARIDLVYSPLMDVKEYPKDVDLCLVEGALCNEDNLALLRKIRLRTRVLVAFGDCAVTGNISGARNPLGPGAHETVLRQVYGRGSSSGSVLPDDPGVLPVLLERVTPLHEAVYVDVYVPGCPPTVERIKTLFEQILGGARPSLQGRDLKFG